MAARVSARLAWLSGALAAMLVLVAPALAGDRALLHILGYSGDARYFMFEEYGIQDGSGFAYSNLYAVDLHEDSWVVGTPIRLRASSEGTSLSAVRAEAAGQGSTLRAELGVDHPADVIALIGDGAPDADARQLTFGLPGYAPGTVRGAFRLSLETFPAEAASPCLDWFGTEPLGYRMSLTVEGEERLLHADGALPRSRGCPEDYRLHAVAVPFNSDEGEGAVAILSYYPFGFEGPDRRFLAVPLGL